MVYYIHVVISWMAWQPSIDEDTSLQALGVEALEMNSS